MSSRVKRYLMMGRDLHRLLNSRQCPENINELHEEMFSENQDLRNATSDMLSANEYQVHMHDAYICGFSEKRTAIGWKSTFYADAIAYIGTEEKGYCRVEFELETTSPLRALSGKEVYSFLIDETTNEVGASFHQPGRNMGIVVAHYTYLSIEKGPVQSWDQLRQEKLATLPRVDATLVVEKDDGQEEYPAKWYSDGTIEVYKDNSWMSYSELSKGKYSNEMPGVRGIFIDAGVEGVRSEVGAQSDDHGPGYASVRPLRAWLSRQQRTGNKERKAKL